MDVFIVVLVLAIVIYSGYRIFQAEKTFKAMGYLPENKITLGTYVSGHPNINNLIYLVSMYARKGNLEIFRATYISMPIRIADIDITLIKDVAIVDKSNFKGKKKQKIAQLIIKWQDGKFVHKTIFEFMGFFAVQKANTARNQILKIIKENT